MNANKALWEKGDFTRIANSMRESGAEVVRRLKVGANMKVLDVGCGDGTTAIPAAQLGAEVLGVDISSKLVAAGAERAASLGLTNCQFQEGDACDLRPLPDQVYNLVISFFGAMFAPKPFDVARELVRVTRSGGRIVMGNWIPGDPTLVAQILKISGAYSAPPPEGFVSPMTWGVQANVVERFKAAGLQDDQLSFAHDTYTFNFRGSPTDFVAAFRDFYGPTMNAFDAAGKSGQAEQLQQELDALFTAQNRSTTPGLTTIPATFLRVTADI